MSSYPRKHPVGLVRNGLVNLLGVLLYFALVAAGFFPAEHDATVHGQVRIRFPVNVPLILQTRERDQLVQVVRPTFAKAFQGFLVFEYLPSLFKVGEDARLQSTLYSVTGQVVGPLPLFGL